MSNERITEKHRSRLAMVYVRQSTQRQVLECTESQRRQRDLSVRASTLGWPKERIVTIDEDLGESGSRSGDRPGFERLVAETALGRVGLILALEPSRLSRGNSDWYHLLDVCAVTRTLLADEQTVYDPRTMNDRLLLGIKGTMSEAELFVLKERMVKAILSRARRGEHRYRLPPGYVWDEAGRMVKTPDDRERAAVELVLSRFQRLGTMHQVQISLAEEGVLVPVLSGKGHTILYRSPSYNYVRRILGNPIYAGAYVFGRRQVEEVLDADQRARKRIRECRPEEWHALIRDHHPGYITFEEYQRNQRQIAANRRGAAGPGAPRNGEALLAGLVLCGRCGRRMKTSYGNRGRQVRYLCVSGRRQTGAALCQSFGARRVEQAVAGLILETLTPLGMEAMIEAARSHQAAVEEERRHFAQRVEAARYDVGLARRQYEAVDPANRLVAAELERRWEQALGELAAAEDEAAARDRALVNPLTPEDEEWLRRCSSDLNRLWEAPTTRPEDRKRIVRCLVENVVVTVPVKGGKVRADIHFAGGEVTTVSTARGKTGHHRYVTDPDVVELVRTLAAEFSDEQIARIFHRKGLKTAKGLSFTARHVTNLRYNYDIEGSATKRLDGEDVYTAEEAGRLFGVVPGTVVRWVETGLLEGSQLTSGAPWKVRVTEEDKKRLTAADAPEGWLPLKGAAQALGVSQKTVLQKLTSGELEGVRVCVGRRTGWRIRVPVKTYDQENTLFGPTDIRGDAS